VDKVTKSRSGTKLTAHHRTPLTKNQELFTFNAVQIAKDHR
jgi:hypothetical protein